ncbi:Aste57867_7747 [Aphanomyces stellatus]|uniref:Aste57867_7747 protein n=1 Tax=Aphanomyces stellatus TaxID=120398 RepID=A0A485KIR4_9STRA|nr:hypothetical protein As57867_007718 [Aphanomyces stellatus]VFT84647.1 Aste57867_7747 [Aphanomyces stellatus]
MHQPPQRRTSLERDGPTIGPDGKSIRRFQKYGGRRAVWPGALALILGISAAIGALVYWGVYEHNQMLGRLPNAANQAQIYGSGHTISDGSNVTTTPKEDIEVTNPIEYKDRMCQQPNYVSKKNQIFAINAAGTETPIRIKGINWLGMEGYSHVISGLWDGPRSGNTLYRIGKMLSDNKFNAVRFPIDIFTASVNNKIEANFNTNSQRALANVKNYTDQIRLLAEGLGQFNIGVVLDFNTRTREDDCNATDQSVIAIGNRISSEEGGTTGNGWFSAYITQKEYDAAVTNLAKALCDAKHWNVMGIDIKDAPQGSAGLWDGEDKTSWQKFASKMATSINKACPSWLVFAQGLDGKTDFPLPDKTPRKIANPPGASLGDAILSPIKGSLPNKVVYAPPFWGPSVKPWPYFYKASTGGTTLDTFTEFSTQADMTASVNAAMTKIFGDLLGQQDSAVVLSSFGSLYGSDDKHPKNSSTMAVNAMIAAMTSTGKTLAGGFWWSLNPDNNWAHPAPDKDTSAMNGLIDTTWRATNPNHMAATKLMDAMPGLAPLPCDPR